MAPISSIPPIAPGVYLLAPRHSWGNGSKCLVRVEVASDQTVTLIETNEDANTRGWKTGARFLYTDFFDSSTNKPNYLFTPEHHGLWITEKEGE